MTMTLEIPRKEIFRYLGYHGVEPSPEVSALVEKCVARLQEESSPRTVHLFFPLAFLEKETMQFGGITVKSHSLATNLQGCTEICVLGGTIGPGADLMIRRAELRKMSEALIYQAAASAMVEELVDHLNKQICLDAKTRGFLCRPRFSPGFGDFSLDCQRDILRLLDAPKRLGVYLLDSLLMTPSKSVTAVIGLYPDESETSTVNCRQGT